MGSDHSFILNLIWKVSELLSSHPNAESPPILTSLVQWTTIAWIHFPSLWKFSIQENAQDGTMLFTPTCPWEEQKGPRIPLALCDSWALFSFLTHRFVLGAVLFPVWFSCHTSFKKRMALVRTASACYKHIATSLLEPAKLGQWECLSDIPCSPLM